MKTEQRQIQWPQTHHGQGFDDEIQNPKSKIQNLFLVRKVISASLLAWVMTVGCTAALAQDQKQDQEKRPSDLTEMSLEDLMKVEVETVYGASKYLQKVTEAPASVTIVTADEIQKFGYRTLADILRSVRGFYVTYDRNYSYIGVRGFARPGNYNTSILLLVDGHRLNDSVYDAAPLGTEFPLDVDLIDHVEIIRGPSSSLYGTNAFLGVINVITKRGRAVKGLDVSGEAASFGTYKGRISFGHEFQNGLEMLLSSSFSNSAGHRRLFFSEFNDQATNYGIVVDADDDQYKQFLATLTFRGFTVQGLYGSREKVIPTASFGTVFNDRRTYTRDAQGYVNLTYEHTFQNQIGLQARAYYDRYNYDGDYVYDYGDQDSPLFVINRDYTRGAWGGAEALVTKTLLSRHKLTAGSEFRRNFRQDQGNYDEDPFYQHLADKRSSDLWALYVQDEFTIRKQLIFNAGVRYDRYDTFGGTINPRLGLIYSPLKKTTFKFLFGEAFRAPNAYELFYQGGGLKFNPKLEPETIKTSEVILEQYFGDRARLTASGFYYRINNLISQQTDPADGLIQYRNAEKAEAKGFEFGLQGRLRFGLEGRLSYTAQESKNQRTGDALANSPRHLAKFDLMLPLIKKKLFAGLEGQFMSKRRNVTGEEVDGFFVSNLTLFSQRLVKGLEISFSAYNVFNKRYGDPGAEEHRQRFIEQDGRSFRLKLTYRFNLWE